MIDLIRNIVRDIIRDSTRDAVIAENSYNLPVTALAAYSLRRLRTLYNGPAIRVRRSSDNAEQDIGFNANGSLNTTALTTFVSANNGFVTTWYDQSSSARHAVQATTSNQPLIVTSGSVNTQDGLPVISFSGGTVRLLISSGPMTGLVANTVCGVFNMLTVSSFETFFYQTDSTNIFAIRRSISSDNLNYFAGGRSVTVASTNINNVKQILTAIRNTGPNCEMYLAGTSILSTTLNNNTPLASGTGYIGGDNSSNGLVGNVQECIIFGSALSVADRQSIERAQGAYYGISVA